MASHYHWRIATLPGTHLRDLPMPPVPASRCPGLPTPSLLPILYWLHSCYLRRSVRFTTHTIPGTETVSGGLEARCRRQQTQQQAPSSSTSSTLCASTSTSPPPSLLRSRRPPPRPGPARSTSQPPRRSFVALLSMMCCSLEGRGDVLLCGRCPRRCSWAGCSVYLRVLTARLLAVACRSACSPRTASPRSSTPSSQVRAGCRSARRAVGVVF